MRALLHTERDLSVVGETANGLEVVDLVVSLKPTLLILDLMMPGLNGLDVLRVVGRRARRTRVIVLSMHANEAYVAEALRHGAAGYVLKDAGVTDLVKAVREVLAGRHYLSPPLSDPAISAYIERLRETPVDPYDTLTRREREILHLVAEGRSSAEIAHQLSISPRTAETHRANLLRKLELRSPADVVRFALRRGILPMEDGPR